MKEANIKIEIESIGIKDIQAGSKIDILQMDVAGPKVLTLEGSG